MPRDNFYEIVPYIYDIKELKNNKLLFYGKQRYERDYPPSFSYKYKFKIIYNYNNFDIELAENEIEYNEWGWNFKKLLINLLILYLKILLKINY